jgi:spermidine synthase
MSPLALTLALLLAGGALGAFVLVRVAPVAAINDQGERVLFRADTQYHRLSVTEAAGVRHLRFDASNQSAIDIADGYRSVIKYPNYMDIALALKPDAKRVLVLGLGAGAITKRWHRDYPAMSIDAVEIDPVVIDVSKRFFSLQPDSQVHIYNQDARRFVQTSSEKYDVVIVDCYYADSMPFHLTTSEFLSEVKAHMAPGGVLAYNVIGSIDGDNSKLFRSMYRTASGVWRNLTLFPIGFADNGLTGLKRNIIVLATDADVSQAQLLSRIDSRVGGMVKVDGFPQFARDLYSGMIPVADVPILTDAHAPTDSLIKVQ